VVALVERLQRRVEARRRSRYFASTSRSFVSTWMSDARRSMAPTSSESTSRTTGLSAGRVQLPAVVARRPRRAARAATRSPAPAGSRRRGGGAARPRPARAGRPPARSAAPAGTRARRSSAGRSRAPNASTRRSPSMPVGTQPKRTSSSMGRATTGRRRAARLVERVEGEAGARPPGGRASSTSPALEGPSARAARRTHGRTGHARYLAPRPTRDALLAVPVAGDGEVVRRAEHAPSRCPLGVGPVAAAQVHGRLARPEEPDRDRAVAVPVAREGESRQPCPW
jgi:hypothetical protein